MIIKDIKLMESELLEKRFAYKYFKDKTIRIGNIISFTSPVVLTKKEVIKSEFAINFLWEVPDIQLVTAVAINYLFTTFIGGLLGTKYLDCGIEMIGSRIIVNKEHTRDGIIQPKGTVSITAVNNVGGACVGYIGLHNVAGNDAGNDAYSLNLSEENLISLMKESNYKFYELMQNLFMEESKNG